MNGELLKLRLAKLWASLTRPSYWGALFSGVAPAVEHRAVLLPLRVDGILDVGANRGQFTLACRLAQPGVPVVAFEPIPKEAATFRNVHGARREVVLLETALGETKGEATLHLSKSADSSSLLPIGKKQTELFENTVEVGTLTVPVQRLDDLGEYWVGRTRQLLKLDVQGFELNVLRGAVETLKTCAYVYAECSEVALYDGQALRVEVEAFLKANGFTLQQRCNEQMDRGELIQADYLFSRPAGTKTER
jgi:FkbM family methyltransferase